MLCNSDVMKSISQLSKVGQLKQACLQGSLINVQNLLKQKFNVDDPDSESYWDNAYNKTALMIASENANIEIMKELIKAGAHVNHNEGMDWPRAGRTVLTYGIHSGSLEAVKLLLDSGVDIEAIADVPGHLNILKPATRNIPHLSYAIMVGSSIEIIELLIKHSKNLNLTDIYIGWTPYMIASFYKNFRAMEALAKAGADINLDNKKIIVPDKFKINFKFFSKD